MAGANSGDSSDDREPSATGEIDRVDDVLEGELVDEETEGKGRVTISSSFKGPLPPPSVLQGYDDVSPGLANTIVEQWQAETAHRHEIVKYANETDRLAMHEYFGSERRSQYVGLGGLALVSAVSLGAILSGETEIGAIALVLGVGPAAVWALRRRTDSPEPPPPTDLANPEGDPPPTQ